MSGITLKENEVEKKLFKVSFRNKDILDRTEIDIFNYIQNNCRLIEVDKFSRGFIDLHKVSKTAKFQDALKILQDKIKPIYIKLGNDSKYWWIGIENYKDALNIEQMTKEFHRIGAGLGLHSLDLIRK